MQAAVFQGAGRLVIKDYPQRKPDDGELLIKVEYCGLCGTDFHIYNGESYSKPPVIPGHEFVGVVADKGRVAGDLQIGDHVAIDPNIYCGRCEYCRRGQINFCANLKALGVSLDGGFAEYSLVPASQAYLLPKDYPLSHAAYAEPLSCCVRGIDKAAIKHGESVVILGGGTIGLLMLQLVKIAGASKIILLEPIEQKRKKAIELGAEYVFDPNSPSMRKDLNDVTNGGPDAVIECVGRSDAAELAVRLPRRGGRVIIFGLSGKDEIMSINLQEFFLKELSIGGSLLNPFTFSRAVELLVTQSVRAELFNTVYLPLGQIKNILNNPRDYSVIKYQITPN